MRIIFKEKGCLSVGEISYATYDAEESCIYASICDETLSKQEFYLHGIDLKEANRILEELYKTGMYDFTEETSYEMELI